MWFATQESDVNSFQRCEIELQPSDHWSVHGRFQNLPPVFRQFSSHGPLLTCRTRDELLGRSVARRRSNPDRLSVSGPNPTSRRDAHHLGPIHADAKSVVRLGGMPAEDRREFGISSVSEWSPPPCQSDNRFRPPPIASRRDSASSREAERESCRT